ncbi:MAG: energy transducer TonB [Bryobacterales bacterium]|nr:energy transducer TonB [Bryobacterales bacterium]
MKEIVAAEPARQETPVQLLSNWVQPEDRSRKMRAMQVSLALHALAVAGIAALPKEFFEPRPYRVRPEQATALVTPPFRLTQPTPNRVPVADSVSVEDLMPRPRVQIPRSTPSTTRPAAPAPGVPDPAPVERARFEPPKPKPAPDPGETAALPPPPPPLDAPVTMGERTSDLAANVLETLPGNPPAPPAIQSDERSTIAFEDPNRQMPVQARAGAGRVGRGTGNLVQDAVREMAGTRGPSGGLMIGDVGSGVGGLGEVRNLPPAPGKVGSNLELLSDPMGVDFRPYLIQILASVRRNWFAVMPESAKLGRRGKVAIQFSIDRQGRVPKLVIAASSGADPLDRAAVAGVSASNPFPPLPAEFRGQQIRVQFTFSYNMPTN